jgi:MFS transporter, ACS family, tartrate transporter
MPVALIVGSLNGGLILDYIDWFGLLAVDLYPSRPAAGTPSIWILLTLADRPRKAKWLSSDEKKWPEGSHCRRVRSRARRKAR